MITPQMATYVLIILAVLLAVIIPVLNAIPKLSDFISYRWLCVTIILLLMVGVVIDFENLADNSTLGKIKYEIEAEYLNEVFNDMLSTMNMTLVSFLDEENSNKDDEE